MRDAETQPTEITISYPAGKHTFQRTDAGGWVLALAVGSQPRQTQGSPPLRVSGYDDAGVLRVVTSFLTKADPAAEPTCQVMVEGESVPEPLDVGPDHPAYGRTPSSVLTFRIEVLPGVSATPEDVAKGAGEAFAYWRTLRPSPAEVTP